jgi:GT2 family glycosyltransferase
LIIIVDNASTDGSFEAIRDFAERLSLVVVRVRVVRSDRNRGYSGGMNLWWLARDPESKYVAFLNNDLVVYPLSLREIVEYMESETGVGAASGLIYMVMEEQSILLEVLLQSFGVLKVFAGLFLSMSVTVRIDLTM